jgi:hypothetical protein
VVKIFFDTATLLAIAPVLGFEIELGTGTRERPPTYPHSQHAEERKVG